MDKRFIEESFPVKEVNEESVREKGIRRGHIANVHMWWARRPLTSSRATNYAALISMPENEIELEKKRKFIIKLSRWENSIDQNIIEKAQNDILEFNHGVRPKILDPFSGGGAIPLEALRLGCETRAIDYNPIAVLIEKCTIEYPQKYNEQSNELWADSEHPLTRDVKSYGKLVLEEAKKDLEFLYQSDEDNNVPVGYIWANTIKCQNPSCGIEIPLMKQFWLSNKKNKKIALLPLVKGKNIEFQIVGQDNPIPKSFDPSKGTIDNAIVHCIGCPSRIEAEKTRELFFNGNHRERMIAVVLKNPQKSGKLYRIPTKGDLEIFNKCSSFLKSKNKEIKDKWGLEPLPNEMIDPNSAKQRTLWLYGMKKWRDVFNLRQKLYLLVFAEKIKDLKEKLKKEQVNEQEIKIIVTFLAFSLDRLISFSTRLCRWKSGSEQNIPIFSGRNAFPMVYDYFEVNPIGNVSTTWESCVNTTLESIMNLKHLSSDVKIEQGSATNIQYPSNHFDAVFTDPPYYDNINYAELSDFFYVWLKRTIGDLYPEYFTTTFTPKSKEIVANPSRQGNKENAKNFFEEMLKTAFQEIYRVLKPEGIFTIVYAHKTTEGWETVINALLDSGLTVTASWPISTEMGKRLNAKDTASLASSIYIIGRKIEKLEIGWYNDIKEEIKNYIPRKLDKLWNEGISGADFFIAAIGSSIEIFGKYKKIMDFEGNEIRANIILNFVRDVVKDYAVRHILHNGIADELSSVTIFYLLWRWNYQEARVPFDEARKLAQSTGIDLSNQWNKGLIKKTSGFIRVLGPVAKGRKINEDSQEMIDILHRALILWKEGEKDQMKLLLSKSGFGNKESLYKVAQAVSETLDEKSSEKKLLDGFLMGKNKLMHDFGVDVQQKLV